MARDGCSRRQAGRKSPRRDRPGAREQDLTRNASQLKNPTQIEIATRPNGLHNRQNTFQRLGPARRWLEGQPPPVVASAPAGLGEPPSRGPPPLSARRREDLSGVGAGCFPAP